MRPWILALFATVLVSSCATITTSELESPVGLATAVRTLPSAAVAGLSIEGRRAYLAARSGVFDEATRRLHLFGDGDGTGDAESMLFLRLFEDDAGRTIAACHAARPFADGQEPSAMDTFIYRLERGQWVDITAAVLPAATPRSWYFRFQDAGEAVPCGPYARFARADGRGQAYRFGPAEQTLRWRDGAFRLVAKGD